MDSLPQDDSKEVREKILGVLTPSLVSQVGDVIVNYFVEVIPLFDGRKEEFFKVVNSFMSGILDEVHVHTLCDSLLAAFKRDQVSPEIDEDSFTAPIRMKDLFMNDPEIKSKITVEYLPAQYLFGKAEDNRRRAPKKRTNNDFIMSPASFFVNRSSTPYLSKDFQIDSISLSVTNKLLIDNSTLRIISGHKYGLIGRNGAGKSTFLRAISSRELNIPPNLNILHVEQEVSGNDTSVLDCILESDCEREKLLKDLKICRQQCERLDPDSNVYHDIEAKINAIYEQLAEIDSDATPSKAAKLLKGLGFSMEMQKRPTYEFSGGWRMRIALARALFCDPDLLLLDEPTNMLDLKSVIWLENYLIKWNKTLIAVSHDRSFLNNISTDTIHLHNKKFQQYPVPYEEFQHIRAEKLKSQAQAFQSQENQRAHIQSFIDKFRYSKRASLVQSRIKFLEKMQVIPEVIEDPTLFFTFPECKSIRPPVIQFQDVGFGYPGQKLLFDEVCFSIDQDSRIALVGENGAGKTTFLNMITGDIEPTKGFLFRHGRLKLAHFSQYHVDTLDLDLNPIEFMMKSFPGHDQQFYRNILAKYGITGGLATQKIETLSGGQKSRLMFAYIAAQEPQIMILDEPINHLDLETVEVLEQALNCYNGGYVITSHDERLITHCCDEIWVISNNRMKLWNGDYQSYKNMILKGIS